ncbi:UDP-N-acetylmuramate dehydrogenase [Pilimelia columellifera]|uniref:UDP-N-acetylenolpyruvoylglucosamine reductase n=1 Tax=Pilimelia columellifera subsp. columellifera TaxID=706583 RepID=A0ABN3NFA7_9ACTN
MFDDISESALAPATPLSTVTTLRLGGPAPRLVSATTDAQLIDAVRGAETFPLILGGGSNVVVADAGVAVPTILIRTRGVESALVGDEAIVSVAAGEPWDEVVAAMCAAGLAGLECLSGIPGAAGATPIQNVGAYGQEVAETIVAVRAFDRVADAVVTMTAEQCRFGYRGSVFKRSSRWVVLGVDFRLARSTLSAPVRYAELAGRLGVAVGERAPLADVRSAVLALRAGKGMVLDPADADTCSVGSFFVNPVLDAAAYQALGVRLAGGEVRAWPMAGGGAKVSAAWLIEQSGFGRGFTLGGGVAVSGKHTLALTNRGGGTTAALLELARHIRDGVHERFGVTLRPEPVLVNCEL